MVKLIFRHLRNGVLLLLAVSILVFILVDLAPGDAAINLAGDGASAEDIARIREELHLDDPVPSRYFDWLSSAVTGDLGKSLGSGESVSAKIVRALPVTVSLMVVTLTITIVCSVVLGTLAAIRRGGLVDKLITFATSIALAMPAFWVGIVLIIFFSLRHPWLPALGYTPLSEGVGEWLKHLILPAIALAGYPTAEMTQQLRGALSGVLARDYILAAQAKGLRTGTLIGKHAFKNAAIPVLTVLGFRIVQMIGGTLVIERVFNMPGIGSLAVGAVFLRDIPVVQGVIMITTVGVVLVNLAVELCYRLVNPRLRVS